MNPYWGMGMRRVALAVVVLLSGCSVVDPIIQGQKAAIQNLMAERQPAMLDDIDAAMLRGDLSAAATQLNSFPLQGISNETFVRSLCYKPTLAYLQASNGFQKTPSASAFNWAASKYENVPALESCTSKALADHVQASWQADTKLQSEIQELDARTRVEVPPAEVAKQQEQQRVMDEQVRRLRQCRSTPQSVVFLAATDVAQARALYMKGKGLVDHDDAVSRASGVSDLKLRHSGGELMVMGQNQMDAAFTRYKSVGGRAATPMAVEVPPDPCR